MTILLLLALMQFPAEWSTGSEAGIIRLNDIPYQIYCIGFTGESCNATYPLSEDGINTAIVDSGDHKTEIRIRPNSHFCISKPINICSPYCYDVPALATIHFDDNAHF